MRINRYLAHCGLGSRRSVEQLIRDGKVYINGKVVRELSTTVDETSDRVEVGGNVVSAPRRFQYILLHKPRGYDVTRGGRHHHRRAWDLLPKGTHTSVQSAGRLDRNSTGLLLFTNDGQLAYRLTHPRYDCEKTYEVEVTGKVDSASLRRLTAGVTLDDGPARALRAETVRSAEAGTTWLRIVMGEGRKWIVRRMCEAIGHRVTELHRTQMGPLKLGGLKSGRTRPLTAVEVESLRKTVGLDSKKDNAK